MRRLLSPAPLLPLCACVRVCLQSTRHQIHPSRLGSSSFLYALFFVYLFIFHFASPTSIRAVLDGHVTYTAPHPNRRTVSHTGRHGQSELHEKKSEIIVPERASERADMQNHRFVKQVPHFSRRGKVRVLFSRFLIRVQARGARCDALDLKIPTPSCISHPCAPHGATNA